MVHGRMEHARDLGGGGVNDATIMFGAWPWPVAGLTTTAVEAAVSTVTGFRQIILWRGQSALTHSLTSEEIIKEKMDDVN
jgi:hypothetical protein